MSVRGLRQQSAAADVRSCTYVERVVHNKVKYLRTTLEKTNKYTRVVPVALYVPFFFAGNTGTRYRPSFPL